MATNNSHTNTVTTNSQAAPEVNDLGSDLGAKVNKKTTDSCLSDNEAEETICNGSNNICEVTMLSSGCKDNLTVKSPHMSVDLSKQGNFTTGRKNVQDTDSDSNAVEILMISGQEYEIVRVGDRKWVSKNEFELQRALNILEGSNSGGLSAKSTQDNHVSSSKSGVGVEKATVTSYSPVSQEDVEETSESGKRVNSSRKRTASSSSSDEADLSTSKKTKWVIENNSDETEVLTTEDKEYSDNDSEDRQMVIDELADDCNSTASLDDLKHTLNLVDHGQQPEGVGSESNDLDNAGLNMSDDDKNNSDSAAVSVQGTILKKLLQ